MEGPSARPIQAYDLALPDDRLILGVKGSVREYELSLFRQRSQETIVAKAKRGALTFTLPAGLSWTPDGQIELHPDRYTFNDAEPAGWYFISVLLMTSGSNPHDPSSWVAASLLPIEFAP